MTSQRPLSSQGFHERPALTHTTWLPWLSLSLEEECTSLFTPVSFMTLKTKPCRWFCPVWLPPMNHIFSRLTWFLVFRSRKFLRPFPSPGWKLSWVSLTEDTLPFIPVWIRLLLTQAQALAPTLNFLVFYSSNCMFCGVSLVFVCLLCPICSFHVKPV